VTSILPAYAASTSYRIFAALRYVTAVPTTYRFARFSEQPRAKGSYPVVLSYI